MGQKNISSVLCGVTGERKWLLTVKAGASANELKPVLRQLEQTWSGMLVAVTALAVISCVALHTVCA